MGADVTTGDGKALFHAVHGNLAGTGAALSETGLGAARQAMRTRKMMGGKTPPNVVPRFLLVSPALEVAADKLLMNTPIFEYGLMRGASLGGLNVVRWRGQVPWRTTAALVLRLSGAACPALQLVFRV